MTEWKFYVPGEGHTDADAMVFSGLFKDHDEATAEDAAKQWWKDGGWESGWPMVIALVAPDGTQSRWTVDHESHPCFFADAL